MLTQAFKLARVIRHELHALDPERTHHLHGHAVVTFVVAEAEHVIGIDRVVAAVLERIGADLVAESDATAFLAQVEQCAIGLRAQLIE